jgi:mono/diheme cytochrome c family protein
MRNYFVFSLAFALVVLGLATFPQSAEAGNNLQEDVLAQGRYIATVGGCTSCHTPDRPEFQNPQTLTLDQIKTLAFDGNDALDISKFLAGGRAFDLGPAGVVYTRNITPDNVTGIGTWTEEQIRVAIKTGVNAQEETLFPVMPYHVYNGMADSDVNAVVAFLRSVNAISNKVPDKTVSTQGLPTPPDQTGIVAPDPSDKAARGAYIVNHVAGCTDCHTPVDPATGAPIMEKYLAGRQPYDGPWGTVYGGNITPDIETGLGSWTEEEIKRATISGISRDGRRLILMPWYAYAAMTPEDADAVAYYLKNGLPAVNNEIPPASLNPDFILIAPEAIAPEPDKFEFLSSPVFWVGLVLALAVLSAVVWFLVSRRQK